MASVRILTDAAVQFPQPTFTGRADIHILPYDISLNGQTCLEGEGVRTNTLPAYAPDGLNPRLLPPSQARMTALLQSLLAQPGEVIAILTSAQLSPMFGALERTVNALKVQPSVTLIDSQTSSSGLGLLVQLAAESVAHGRSLTEIERRIRHAIPRVYTLFSSAGLSYLHHAGFIDPAQAAVGEMLNLFPIFSLEEGRPSAIEKARNPRGLSDFFIEFLDEFDELDHIGIIQGHPAFTHEAHALKEYAQVHFPNTPVSELPINPSLATLIGPRSLGLVILEPG